MFLELIMAGRNTGEKVRGTFYFRTWLVWAVRYWGGRWLLSPSIKALNSEHGGRITRPWGDNKFSFSYMKCCWQGRRPRDWRFLSSSLTWPMGQSQSEQVTDPYGTGTSGILLILFWKVAAVWLEPPWLHEWAELLTKTHGTLQSLHAGIPRLASPKASSPFSSLWADTGFSLVQTHFCMD